MPSTMPYLSGPLLWITLPHMTIMWAWLDTQTTARQSGGAFLLYRFHVLATRTIKDVNLRHFLKLKMADKMHGAVTIAARQASRLIWRGAHAHYILARQVGRALR